MELFRVLLIIMFASGSALGALTPDQLGINYENITFFTEVIELYNSY